MSGLPIVLLTSGSPWQRALAARMASTEGVGLVAVVVERVRSTRRPGWIARQALTDPMRLIRKVEMRLRFGVEMERIAREELEAFGIEGHPRDWPPVEVLEVDRINDPEVLNLLDRSEPRVVAVSGTSLVREPLLSHSGPEAFLNLHTGLSPFYKGGPNCTLWALACGEPQYVGSTIHVLDPGIDSGAIVLSAHTPLLETTTLAQAVCASVEVGHRLYVRVLSALAAGRTLRPVPQATLGEGRTFFTREWSAAEMARAVRFVESGGLARWVASGCPGRERVHTVDWPLPEGP